MQRKNGFRNNGKVWIWLSSAALGAIIVMMLVLFFLIAVNGLRALWPYDLALVRLADGATFLGVAAGRDVSPEGLPRTRYRVANRDLNAGTDFRWVLDRDVTGVEFPPAAVVVKRAENGDLFGYLAGDEGMDAFLSRLAKTRARWNASGEPVRARLAQLGDRWQTIHLAGLKAAYRARHAESTGEKTSWEARLADSARDEAAVKAGSESLLTKLNALRSDFDKEKASFKTAEGKEATIPLLNVLDLYGPNRLGVLGKARLFWLNAWNLVSQNPREANTEGGVFPALFGTAVLVLLLAVTAFPLGVAAGVYLREYARDGFLARTARVAVNNLAGVPSIVYGIFGLGFFVYGVGGGIDRLFFPERVEAGIATFGGGGILWASLTLGLLTLPVVVTATDEALGTVPSEMRQGSLALGATRFQTLWRVTLPMASPGILTGLILAMARAAGEVAPLMLTGVVKSAESLPVDSIWPFVHLERKFMHLGFHIYDMGFQSPNVEAAKPMVYLTALVLLVLVFSLNLAAFKLRSRMRAKYAIKGF